MHLLRFLLLVAVAAMPEVSGATDVSFLVSGASSSDAASPIHMFEGLIGNWNIDYRFFNADGAIKEAGLGQWNFRWILDGNGNQDEITFYRPDGFRVPILSEHGTTIRYIDPRSKTLNAIWFGLLRGNICRFVVKQVDATIVNDGSCNGDSSLERWIFSGIGPDVFHWQGYYSDDQGHHWILEEEINGRRIH